MSDWTKIRLNLRYHWKAVLIGIVGTLVFVVLTMMGRAEAWMEGSTQFARGEATVILHAFCQSQDCGPLTDQEWRDLIQDALDKWNGAGSSFIFYTRPVRPTDDPCNYHGGEVAVIVTDSNRGCPGWGDVVLPGNADLTITVSDVSRATNIYISAAPTEDRATHLFVLSRQLLWAFGTVLGLRPDPSIPVGESVMNGRFTDGSGRRYPDELQPDDIAGIRALYPPSYALVGFLENPQPNSSQSGIGVISGWVCEAERIEVIFDGKTEDPWRVGYGTRRTDTDKDCGDTDNGFGLLFNWNLLGNGLHEVVVLVDGEELGRATVTVTTLGKEVLHGATGKYVLDGFPNSDSSVVIQWEQSLQNFVITGRRDRE